MTSPTIETVAECLIDGGVVLIPTDTVLGLAVSPAHPQAVDRLYALKDRPREKNLPIMAASPDQIDALGGIRTNAADRLISSGLMPGALTLVLGLDPTRTPNWLSGREEIAFRIPDEPFLRAVLGKTGPLMLTSANRSGHDTPATSDAATAQLTGQPDLVVAGESRAAAPSTIVNCRTSPVTIERQGAIPAARIFEILEASQ